MAAGTFRVARSVWTHPAFKPSEFSEREAFLWLVSEASWKPRTVRAGRVMVDLERGQLCASVRFLADAWGWSKSRVDRFLKRVSGLNMIRTESGTGQLVVTVCNYDEYQGERDTSGTEAGQKRDTSGTNEKKEERRGNKGRDKNPLTPKPSPSGPKLEDVVPAEAAADYRAHRRALKAPLTAGAEKGICKALEEISARGIDPTAALEEAAARGWRGLKAEWVINAMEGNRNEPKHRPSGASTANAKQQADILNFFGPGPEAEPESAYGGHRGGPFVQ